MDCRTAHKLDIVMSLAQDSLGSFSNQGERLRDHLIDVVALPGLHSEDFTFL